MLTCFTCLTTGIVTSQEGNGSFFFRTVNDSFCLIESLLFVVIKIQQPQQQVKCGSKKRNLSMNVILFSINRDRTFEYTTLSLMLLFLDQQQHRQQQKGKSCVSLFLLFLVCVARVKYSSIRDRSVDDVICNKLDRTR